MVPRDRSRREKLLFTSNVGAQISLEWKIRKHWCYTALGVAKSESENLLFVRVVSDLFIVSL